MTSTPDLLFLTLRTFSATGGIEKVSRNLSKVIGEYYAADPRAKVLSLCDRTKELDERFLRRGAFRGFSGNKIFYGLCALRYGFNAQTIILSHINLLMIGFLIKTFRPKTRIILLAHGIEVWRPLNTWKTFFIRDQVDIWAVSEHTAEQLIEQHQIPPERIHILPNSLDPFIIPPIRLNKPTALLQRYQLALDNPVLYTLARLSSSELYKGYDTVIKSLPELITSFPALKYILAGKADVVEEARIRSLIEQLGLRDHVILPGFIPETEMIDHFLLADVFIMPSRKEGFGIVFIEAIACGCPVIAGDQDGSVDALLKGKLGTLIDPNSIQAVGEALRLSIDQRLPIDKRRSLQDLCLENFSFERYRQNVRNLLSTHE